MKRVLKKDSDFCDPMMAFFLFVSFSWLYLWSSLTDLSEDLCMNTEREGERERDTHTHTHTDTDTDRQTDRQ